ncbi:DUF6089 family protein, partial [Fulvivirga aurantia]|uniref:DUF6089 family protein n=1 Tax=Fulvivirga aurantia TaxID=2529383 RepID=UPI001627983A
EFFSKEKRYNYIAVSLNAFNYFGDLAPLNKNASTDISFTRPAVGVMFGHRFGPFYSLRASFTYGTLRGDDYVSADIGDENARYRYVRNLNFRNRIKELTVVGVFDLFKNEATYISRVQWTPYAFAGLTVFHHNPQAYVNENSSLPEAGTWVDLEPLGTEGQYASAGALDGAVNEGIEPYSKIQIAIPIGLGIRYRLNQVLDFSFEMSYRYLFTDYIDDVSQNYVDPSVLTSDLARELAYRSNEPTAAVSGEARDFEAISTFARDNNGDGFYDGFGTEGEFNLRGNKDQNDMYFVTTIKVAYILGATFRRAKFR